MLRKTSGLFLFCFLLLSFSLLSPSLVSASCRPTRPNAPYNCVGVATFTCVDDNNGGIVTCCDLSSECPAGSHATRALNNAWCTHPDGTTGVWTALGCLEVGTPNAFIGQLLPWAVGLAGLIALISIVYAGFLIVSAGGDPKKIAAGKEIIITAITGLAIIALSVVLLNFIGVKILDLSHLGFNV